MKAYFNPDINSLREIPEVMRKEMLGLVEEPVQETAPDLLMVDQLLHMIRFARETRTAPVGC